MNIKGQPEPIKTMGDIYTAWDDLCRLKMEILKIRQRMQEVSVGRHPDPQVLQDYERLQVLLGEVQVIMDRPLDSC